MMKRFSTPPRRLPAPAKLSPATVIRRFFDLIERLDRPHRAPEPHAPETKARITRLDADVHRDHG